VADLLEPGEIWRRFGTKNQLENGKAKRRKILRIRRGRRFAELASLRYRIFLSAYAKVCYECVIAAYEWQKGLWYAICFKDIHPANVGVGIPTDAPGILNPYQLIP
jgi:hypothetical protein